jgi:hypothetical protein
MSLRDEGPTSGLAVAIDMEEGTKKLMMTQPLMAQIAKSASG